MIRVSHESNWVSLRGAHHGTPLLRIGRRLLDSISIHLAYLRLPLDGQEQEIPVFSVAKPGSEWRVGLRVVLLDAEVSPSEHLRTVLRLAHREGYIQAKELPAFGGASKG